MSLIDDYLETLEPSDKNELERIRSIVITYVPEAEEVISYGMPGFKYKGKYLAGYSAFKDHLSFFPGSAPIEALKAELKEYKTSKGTIKFTLEHPLPEELIKELIVVRKKDIDS